MSTRPPSSTLFPYTTLFRSVCAAMDKKKRKLCTMPAGQMLGKIISPLSRATRSEEHTSELQSHSDLVCRLLLEKKKTVQPLPVADQSHGHARRPLRRRRPAT